MELSLPMENIGTHLPLLASPHPSIKDGKGKVKGKLEKNNKCH
jgi:hypothetical protein